MALVTTQSQLQPNAMVLTQPPLDSEFEIPAAVAGRTGSSRPQRIAKAGVKMVLIAVLLLTAVFGGKTLWLADFLDRTVADAIEQHGSAMAQARISVGSVKIATASGKGTISDFMIGNPAGFRTRYALKAAQIDMEIDIASVGREVTVVRHVLVNAPEVIYELGESTTNFEALQMNVAAYLARSSAGKAAGTSKVIIDELTICNARALASAPFMRGKTISIALPDITLRNIGKARGGAGPGELGEEIAAAMKAKLTATTSFDRLQQSATEIFNSAGAAVKGLFR
jgi:hypothetical protein